MAISGTGRPSGTGCARCGSTSVRATGSTSCAAQRPCISYWRAAIRRHRRGTYGEQRRWCTSSRREVRIGSDRMAKRKSRLEIAPFDAAEYLDNEEVIAEYLSAALEDANPDVFLQAVADVAKARGISKVAKDAGLGRESLYKALAPGAKIRYDTVRKLLDSLGVRLTVITP